MVMFEQRNYLTDIQVEITLERRSMNIGICDDEKVYREKINKICEQYAKKHELKFVYILFTSGEQLIENKEEIDILFLDIEMSGIDGLKVMESLEGRENIKRIIFVSSHDEYVFDTYSSKTRGFIRKPISYDDMVKNINKVVHEITENKFFMIETEGDRKYIKSEDLIYLKGMGNYVKLVTLNDEYTIYGNIKHWNEQLEEYGIIRVHKSFLVNLKYVKHWDKILYIEERDIGIPVGRKFYTIGEEIYHQYLLKRMRRV